MNLSFSKLFDPAILRDIKSNSPPLLWISQSEEIEEQAVRDTQSNYGRKSCLDKLADLRVKNKPPSFLKNHSSSSNIPGGKLAIWDEHMDLVLFHTTVINLVKPYQGPPNPIS